MNIVRIQHLHYFGQKDNIKFLECIEAFLGTQNLYRASEEKELWRVLKYGTDRGGFPPRMWENTELPYEYVIYGTTGEDIRLAHINEKRSSSFKKFAIINDPVLLVYDLNLFRKIADRQWVFIEPTNKLDALKYIIFLRR